MGIPAGSAAVAEAPVVGALGGSPAGRVAETALRDRAAADESPAGIKGVFPAVAGGVSRESEAKCVEESCEEK